MKTKLFTRSSPKQFAALTKAKHVPLKRGIVVMGIPVGTREFVAETIEEVLEKSRKFCEGLEDLEALRRRLQSEPPDGGFLQMARGVRAWLRRTTAKDLPPSQSTKF